MSTVKVDSIKHTSTDVGGIVIDGAGHVTVDDLQMPTAGALSNRNLVINGAMVHDQRNAGASGTAIAYTVDRWAYYASQASKVTWQQNAGAVTPPAGYKNYIGFTSSSAYTLLAADQFLLYQPIEGNNIAHLNFGSASASTVTLSFWVRSSLTGTFGGSLANSDSSRVYPYSFIINSANTWEQKTITVPGDTTGTWLTDNGRGMKVQFSLGTGATYSGAVNAWTSTQFTSAPTGATSVVSTNGATFYVTGVQLEVGSKATPFEHRSIGDELDRCKRYYKEVYAANLGSGSSFWPTYFGGSAMTYQQDVNMGSMRAGPNIAIKNSDTAIEYYSFGAVWTATTVVASGLGEWPHRILYLVAASDGDGRTKLARRQAAGATPALSTMIATLDAEL